MRTHKDLTDPRLRTLLVREFLILRYQMKRAVKAGTPFDKNWVWGIFVGLDTAFRRVQDANLLQFETSPMDEP